MARFSNPPADAGVVAAVGCGMLFVWAIITIPIVWICSLMFQHSLWVITGKDVPWYLDVLGALVLNGLNIIVWVICLIIEALGIPTPLYPLG
jgi:hypothetical protein